MGGKNLTYEEYVKSGVWKCDKSPTGAHHWVELKETTKLAKEGYFVCIYCHDVKKFPTNWEQVSKVWTTLVISGGEQ